MKRFLLSLAGLILIAAIAWFALAPGIFEKQTNMVDGKPLPEIRAEVQELHDSLFIVDLHSDTLLWKRKITDSVDYGHVDMKRLQQGNVGLQIFSSVTKTPKGQNYDSNSAETDNITLLAISQLQPFHTWFSLFERQMWHMTKLDRAVADAEGQLAAITVSDNVAALQSLRQSERAQDTQPRTIGVMFSAEGLHTLEGQRENLEKFYNAGMRMAGLVHFFDNDLAGSMHGEEKGGLTEFGREIVRDMEEMGMIVDIAHCSHQCVADILEMARRPVVSSHGGVQEVCGVNRNLTDEEIRGVAATGGIIGLGYWDGAMCDTDPKSVAKAVLHVRNLVGIEHAALGSDFDGAVTTRFDTSGIVHVTQALIDAGLSEEEIRAVMGGNALRVLEQGLIPLLQLPEEKPALDQSAESGQ
ncbi:MAG: dipeptidase [Pseudomonadota bacterium]